MKTDLFNLTTLKFIYYSVLLRDKDDHNSSTHSTVYISLSLFFTLSGSPHCWQKRRN